MITEVDIHQAANKTNIAHNIFYTAQFNIIVHKYQRLYDLNLNNRPHKVLQPIKITHLIPHNINITQCFYNNISHTNLLELHQH